jgi:hypothetical protein
VTGVDVQKPLMAMATGFVGAMLVGHADAGMLTMKKLQCFQPPNLTMKTLHCLHHPILTMKTLQWFHHPMLSFLKHVL